MSKRFLLTGTFLLLTACDLSPDMKLPDIAGGDQYKEAPTAASDKSDAKTAALEPASDVQWKRVDEKAQIEEIAWWRMFNDPALNALEEQAMKDNPDLDVAAERLKAARANAEISDSSLFPSVTLGAGPERQRPAAAGINGSFPSSTPIRTKPYTTYTVQGSIAYELDLFGLNRNTARAAWFSAEAEENNYRAARLALQATIAQTYFTQAALVAEVKLLDDTYKAQQDSFDLTTKQHSIGTIDDLAYSTAQTQLANVAADRAAVAQQLAVNTHALATLTGVAPAQFSITAATLSTPPVIPAGLPSTLLERRPDVQSAAKNMASANAEIGAARAGFFPDISLSAAGGYSSNALHNIFKSPNKFWSLGAPTSITQTIFDGGVLTGTLKERHAEYDAATASYRSAALTAFREVEDNLSNLRTLADQAQARGAAAKAAARAYKVAGLREQVGYASHLDYLDAERSNLAAQRSEIQIQGQRYIATVQLIKALGGTWLAAPATPANAAATSDAPAPAATPKKDEAVAPAPVSAKDAAPIAAPAKAPAPATSATPAADAAVAPATAPTTPPKATK